MNNPTPKGSSRTQAYKDRLAETRKGSVQSPDTKAQIASTLSENHQIQRPDGSVESITNLSAFCRANGLGASNLLANGSSKGYVMVSSTKTIRKYSLQKEEGEITICENLKKFCKIHGMSNAGLLSRFREGQGSFYCGWRIIGIEKFQSTRTY